MRLLPEKFAQGMLILKRLNIAFGIHNKGGYYIHALAAMHSVMKAASVPVSAHILHDETKDRAPVHRPRFREYIRHIFGDYSGYFNSGVVVFKNPALNRLITNFADAVMNVLRERPELQFPDQDALNLLLGVPGHVGYLSGKANFQMEYGNRINAGREALKGKLIHYSWHKPWNHDFPAGSLYWENRNEVDAMAGN